MNKPFTKSYVAGSSKELPRCRAAMELLAFAGVKQTVDWISAIQKDGVANEGLDEAKRRRYAEDDFRGVAEAEIIWLLASDKPTTGSWVELGIVLALERVQAAPTNMDGETYSRIIVVSGAARHRCIFASMADYEFDDDLEAAVFLLETVKHRKNECDQPARSLLGVAVEAFTQRLAAILAVG